MYEEARKLETRRIMQRTGASKSKVRFAATKRTRSSDVDLQMVSSQNENGDECRDASSVKMFCHSHYEGTDASSFSWEKLPCCWMMTMLHRHHHTGDSRQEMMLDCQKTWLGSPSLEH